MIATGGTVDLAEGIIDDTCLVSILIARAIKTIYSQE